MSLRNRKRPNLVLGKVVITIPKKNKATYAFWDELDASETENEFDEE